MYEWKIEQHDTKLRTGGTIRGTRVTFGERVIEWSGRLSRAVAISQSTNYWIAEDFLRYPTMTDEELGVAIEQAGQFTGGYSLHEALLKERERRGFRKATDQTEAVGILSDIVSDTEVSDEAAEILLSAAHYLKTGAYNVRRPIRKAFSLSCGCGWKVESLSERDAEDFAMSHAVCGSAHAVMCTRPASFIPGSTDITIVSITNIAKTPHTMRYVERLTR